MNNESDPAPPKTSTAPPIYIPGRQMFPKYSNQSTQYQRGKDAFHRTMANGETKLTIKYIENYSNGQID